MNFGTRVWGAGKFLALVGALIATYVLAAAAGMRLATRAREVTVPDFTNKTASEATVEASTLGFGLKVDDSRRPDAAIAAGRVLTQDPTPGSVARTQRTVRVWLSAGQRVAAVPALTGESQRTAELRLAQSGLAVAAISEIDSPAYGADVVVAQDPPASTGATRIALLVNRGQQAVNYVMPDLIGVNGERAADLLRARDFRVALASVAPYPGAGAGTVVRQSPQAGFQLAPGEPISLEVSR